MKNKLKSLQNKLYVTLLKIESIHEVIKELSLSTDSLEKFKIARQALTEFKNILDDELFTPNNIFDKPIKSELNCDVKTESKHLPSIDNDSADDCKNIFAKYEIEDIVVKSEDNFNYNEDLATNPNYNVVNKVEHNDGSDDENSDGELQGEAPDRKKKDKIQCTGCKFLFLKRNYEAHQLRCRNGGPVQCSLCDATMKNRSMLLKHNRRYHTQTPGISCDICYKELANMAELAAHKMTHRNQTCHICGMVIKGTNNNFKYHMKTHDANRERTKSCDICGQSFFRENHLRKHKLVKHTSERPYQCDMCTLSFKVDCSLKKHKENTHGVLMGKNTYKCEVCDKTFSMKDLHSKHMKRYHTIKEQKVEDMNT